MIIDGQVYRDELHPKHCFCEECLAKDEVKRAFAQSYENTFGGNPADATEDETDEIIERSWRSRSGDQSDGVRADND